MWCWLAPTPWPTGGTRGREISERRVLLDGHQWVPGSGHQWILFHGQGHRVFSKLDTYAFERLARLISGKHGRSGFRHGRRVLTLHQGLGLAKLSGSVVYGTRMPLAKVYG